RATRLISVDLVACCPQRPSDSVEAQPSGRRTRCAAGGRASSRTAALRRAPGLSRAPPWYGGGRRFESIRGLCKSAARRRFLVQTDLLVVEGAVGMEPFMELSRWRGRTKADSQPWPAVLSRARS